MNTSRVGLIGMIVVQMGCSAVAIAGGRLGANGVEETGSPRWFYCTDDHALALGGNDPVSYFESTGPVHGAKEFEVEHKGIRYRFANRDNIAAFQKSPERYLPAFGGWCAFVMGRTMEQHGAPPMRVPGDPGNYAIRDGRLFLFVSAANVDTRALWEQQAEQRIENAELFWKQRLVLGARVDSKPAGLHRMARMETLEFDFLIGQWKSKYSFRVSPLNEAKRTIEGTWKAWYGWDGFAVYDDWKQVGGLPGNNGPAIRSFDPINQQWVMHFIPINAPVETVWQMTGTFDEKGEMHGEMELSDGSGNPFLQRIHFVNIKPDSFTWRSDRSYDGGKTWIENWGVGKNTRVDTGSVRGKTSDTASG